MAHQHQHHRFDDAASVSSYSSGSSSRSSSRSSSSSGGSKKSRSSQTSHSNIKGDHWTVSFMKWTTGAPPGKQLALRKTKVCDYEEDWDYDDGGGSVYSDASYISYAWVSPKWDDSISEIASRSSSRSSGRLRREQRGSGGGRHRFPVPPVSYQPPPPPPPPFNHPPPPPPPGMAPGPGFPMYDDEPAFFDMDPGYHQPPPAAAFGGGGGGDPGFVDLNAGGGGGGPHFPGNPGKYDDWAD
ncbi:hypothetical protein CNYM01_11623 [Colletotrichum nymphaeae SA-01]|uniref:Uncharacterized protein n=1 Tax=Colletotrichum nymphaeae SA-01 TaxID=1460502 RepID=A0A135SH62_9PEZI|nr:hypothetical protein CNYM01_11623 [Colletotrichum nymphaeae SA-01]